MNSLENILQKYPDADINRSGGTDSFREGLPIVERNPIAVVIKHPEQNLYLLAHWVASAWTGFLTGGIEDGDTLEQTVIKEVAEETGYTNVSKIIPTDCVAHGLFFHPVKNVNRLAHYHLVVAELGSLEQIPVSEEEKKIAHFEWHEETKVLDLLTRSDMKILWKYYVGNKG
jgi:8-oxo-dGTP pyrophosphatase MutT (NUDIX family)